MTKFFEDYKIKVEEEKKKADKRSAIISYLRIVDFIAALFFIYNGFSNGDRSGQIIGIILMVAFFILIKIHSIMFKLMSDSDNKIECCNRYIKRIDGGWKEFKSDGSGFIPEDDTLSRDIDLLGSGSLFQLISVAHSKLGKEKLAKTLLLEDIDPLKSKDRHEAIKLLSEKLDFMIDVEAASQKLSGKNKAEGSSFEVKKLSFPAWMFPIMILIPLINIFVIGLVVTGQIKATWIIVSFLIGLIVTYACKAKLSEIIIPVYQCGIQSGDYLELLKVIDGKFSESKILKECCNTGYKDFEKGLKTIGQAYNITYNPIANMLLSGFFGYDFYLALIAAGWNNKKGKMLKESVEKVALLEELMSLAVLSVVRKTTEFKLNTKDDHKIVCKNLSHPLLDVDKAVANTVTLDNKLTIITGSNMSGKTTFLRTLAINLVLGYIGAGVCGDEFEAPHMKLFTSMRVSDDVANGISTFYAEILRIKGMAEYIGNKDNKIPALCLIDEIFKGTNSADRIYGAQEALKKLSSGKAMVIVSTHDFELCDLKGVDGNAVENYHFEEHYESNELKFDYKIKDGRCKTRNAKALLKIAGLLDD